MKRKFFSVIVAVFFMQGCASTYIEPSDGPMAQIRFVSHVSSAANVLVHSYKAEDCKTGMARVAALSGIALSHNRKKLDLPLNVEFDERDFTETYIRANQPYVFDMSWWAGSAYTGTTSCQVTMVFEPKENQIYEASFRMGSDACQVDVNKIVKRNGDYARIPESSARRSLMQCN